MLLFMRIDNPELPHGDNSLNAGHWIDHAVGNFRQIGWLDTNPDVMIRRLVQQKFVVDSHPWPTEDHWEEDIRIAKEGFSKLEEACPSIAVVPTEYFRMKDEIGNASFWAVSRKVEGTSLKKAMHRIPGVKDHALGAFDELKRYLAAQDEDDELMWTDIKLNQFMWGSIGYEDPRIYLVDVDPIFQSLFPKARILLGDVIAIAGAMTSADEIIETTTITS